MAYSNNNKRIHDTPVLLPTGQFRVATNALASMTTAKNTNDRYLYYLSGALFYKYDTYTDTHIRLASPNTAAVTASSIKYSSDEGYRGNVLDATLSAMTIPALYSDLFVGKKIKITAGAGYGQERTIISVDDPVIIDSGVATAASTLLITDTTKRWEINQYIGYQVRIVYGAGVSQVRKVLYNDSNTLYFSDVNYQQLETWNNQPFSIVAPYVTPGAVAGSQTHYVIESAEITLDTPLLIPVDSSSSFLIKSGGLFMISSLAAAPWSSLQYYDVLSDVWVNKTALGGVLLAALGTDFELEMITEEVPFETGTTTSSTLRTLSDTTKNMVIDRYCNFSVKVIGGPGTGEENRIIANGTDYFEIERNWLVQPTTATTYEIHGEINRMYLVGNGASSIYQYSIEHDTWFCGQSIEYGQTRNASFSFNGQEGYGITSCVLNNSGITSLSSTPTVGGSGYAVGDLFNITTGGTVGKGRVEAISGSGVVTQVSLYAAGINYTTGAGKVTTNISGTGNGALTVNILTIGKVGRITSATNVNLYKGDSIVITGANEAAWSGVNTVLAIDSLTTFDILTAAAATLVPSFTNSTTVIVDSTKNWVINEHVGRIIKLDTAGTAPTSQFRRIISNTTTTITVATIVAGSNGISRYTINNPEAFGRDRQYLADMEAGEGRASSGTTTTLTDSSKNWLINQWAGYRFRVLAGTGIGSEIAITANTSTTLFTAGLGFTPDTTTKYQIMDTFGIATAGSTTTLTDTTKNWQVNKWAGKRVVFTTGTGQRIESTITSNTANALTFGVTTAPDTTTCYTILGVSPRSTAAGLRWIFGNTELIDRGNYLISIRGGGTNTIDKYSIPQDKWERSVFYSPQSETFNTSSSYTYDGVNTMYVTSSAVSDFIYVLAIDMFSLEVIGAFQTTVLQGAVHIGNFAEVVSSPDGGKFLFLGICSSRLMYKGLIS